MAKIICSKDEYEKLSTVLMDNPEFLADISILYDIVEKSPTIPAVRCKDCKYAQNPNDTMVYCTYFECGTMSQNDFCSQGEKRC